MSRRSFLTFGREVGDGGSQQQGVELAHRAQAGEESLQTELQTNHAAQDGTGAPQAGIIA